MVIKKCPHCNKELPENAQFCGHCGKGQSAMTEALICPKCNKSYDSSWKVCLYCSEALIDENGSHITAASKDLPDKQITDQDALICPKCNKSYDNSWKVCLYCRETLIKQSFYEKMS